MDCFGVMMLAVMASWAPAAWGDSHGGATVHRNALIENGSLIQIPGPNPLVSPGGPDDWDAAVVEAGGVFKDRHTYYFYYHGVPRNREKYPRGSYRIGVATAPHPLGPWTKHGDKPIIDIGEQGSWKDRMVACPAVLKEEGNKYYLWYGGGGGDVRGWKVGLATADHPLGPWKEYEGNPVLVDFGFVGGVVKVNGKYMMYNVWRVGSVSPDSGPIVLATADKPEGPWTKYEGNPVIPAGEWGAWDDGGFSEAGMLYHDGVYHCFYGGVKWEKLESIGYAYSYDGVNFIKYAGNPIAPRENTPDTHSYAEIHALHEPPFYYLFHTFRHLHDGGDREYLGVQILVNQTPFTLKMPILNLEGVASGVTTELGDCPPISLTHVSRLALTAECRYASSAKKPLRIHVRSSADGMNFDTVDLYDFENAYAPGQVGRKTIEMDTKVRFIKVLVENPNGNGDVSHVKVTATLGG